MHKKIFLTGILTFLFIGITFSPVIAQITLSENTSDQETCTIEKFMDSLEKIASESRTFSEFTSKIQDLCLTNENSKFPVVQEFITKMLQLLTKERIISTSNINLQDFLGIFSSKLRPNYFVISYGAYHRLNPLKENSINRFRERLSMWRYSDTSKLLKGRTIIFERHPFGIHQKMLGPQIGFMKGFKGIYIDIESKLTGNAYVFFLGSVHRIRAFDLTPLSK